eukprot:COSAG06_NODE_39864_length_408_cov_0.566343_2_plen_43_part_01
MGQSRNPSPIGQLEVDARQAIATAETGHWKPVVKNYSWRNIAG